MIKLAIRICLLVTVVCTAVLAVTALPSLTGGHLSGKALIVHMMASGGVVTALPILGILMIGQAIGTQQSNTLLQLGFWLTLVTGLLSIASVFMCMLPMASTLTMHTLVEIHGYTGFAMVPAVTLLTLGMIRCRRMHSIRSTTPG
ncbi:hypothetical protein Pla52o_09320 [Novipirellula galeiformis]|uniref:Uncharacterized protein n=1 Tax=Novipirellula galeiformis TaxID=2528004 RepID=A0A5C6CQ44_9BACT|nr:hypothetical protein [Novipirellula galeiformis]TWU27073.1 hypothetical protein Pla52o_09320 [Novipirellula galeiformis]